MQIERLTCGMIGTKGKTTNNNRVCKPETTNLKKVVFSDNRNSETMFN